MKSKWKILNFTEKCIVKILVSHWPFPIGICTSQMVCYGISLFNKSVLPRNPKMRLLRLSIFIEIMYIYMYLFFFFSSDEFIRMYVMRCDMRPQHYRELTKRPPSTELICVYVEFIATCDFFSCFFFFHEQFDFDCECFAQWTNKAHQQS